MDENLQNAINTATHALSVASTCREDEVNTVFSLVDDAYEALVKYANLMTCPNCKGQGGFSDGQCVQCVGTGIVEQANPYANTEAAGLIPEHLDHP